MIGRMRKAARAALAIAVACSASPAAAQPGAPGAAGAVPLEAAEVLSSVDRAFPLLERARRDRDVAEGEALEARGNFDLKLKAAGETVDGYYDNERLKATVEQPLAPLGMTLFGGYRIGRGPFPVYDEKALTLDEGEWSGGFNLPLLRNRAVDARRADRQVADLGVDVAAQGVAKARLSVFKDALKQYWEWAAAGRQLGVVRGLLDLAERRDVDLADAVRLGQLAPVERTDNLRAILQRRSALVTAQRVVEATAINLSLFYRAPDGTPLRPSVDRVPAALPEPVPLTPEQELEAVDLALRHRPEVVAQRLKRSQQEVQVRAARNTLLPTLDLFSDVSRDFGEGRPTREGTEVQAGVFFELPLQRRKASGKTRQAEAKLAGIDADLRFLEDRVRADVQDAASALRAAYATVELVRQELTVARELEGLERDRFQLGDSTQFLVNLRELNTADAAFREVKALADYQKALVDFEAASGRLVDRVPVP
jgi:cobalt-zinc-cadmium efflux system outer membrane protein